MSTGCRHTSSADKVIVYKNEKSRILTNTALMWEAGTEPDAKDPEKQGLFNDGGSLTPQFSPHQNYFEQILSFFDSLEADEQESLLDALKERVKATK